MFSYTGSSGAVDVCVFEYIGRGGNIIHSRNLFGRTIWYRSGGSEGRGSHTYFIFSEGNGTAIQTYLIAPPIPIIHYPSV